MPQSMHHTYPVPSTRRAPVPARPRLRRLAFHVPAAAVMINVFSSLPLLSASSVINRNYGGFWQYLTILGLFASISCMVTSTASDMLPGVKVLRELKRAILLLALPVELVISSIYWPLVLFARHLIFPQNSGEASGPEPSAMMSETDMMMLRIPLWMDLCMHAFPALALVADFFLLESPYTPPVSTWGALALAILGGGGYASWVEHTATVNGAFPYPFLTMMPFAGRVSLYVASTVGATLVFRSLNKLHR